MDKEKEIEKMAHVIKTSQSAAGYYFPTKAALRMARGLSEAGYGDVRAAVREFAENVKMAFYYEFDELIPSRMADKIDELVKEMCGDD
nr:MAG TPA: hypothetical protein [Caudoviricetes sp.]